MAHECKNCEEEIEEGKEIFDEDGDVFCSEEHQERYKQ